MAPSRRSRSRRTLLANLTFVSCLKCGQGRGAVPPPSIPLSRPQVNGIYQLASYPGCVAPYTGEGAHETLVYVLGFGTELERLFKRTQRSEYIAYYNSHPGIALWHDYADRFCSQAMTDLLS